MSHILHRFRSGKRWPVFVLCALALLISALRPPAAAALPAGIPLGWGYNGLGGLGNGTFTDSAYPVPVSNLTNVVAVDGGANHGLALKADGSVWAWGDNYDGRVGNGIFSGPVTTPVQVINLSGAIAIAAGRDSSMAIKADGTLWAWGLNATGQLGDGTLTNRNKPVRVANLSGVIAMRTGDHSLALKSDGSVWAWGLNDSGQLGDGTTINRSTPVRVANLPGVVAIAARGRGGLALAPDGTVWTWGDNSYGQLGIGVSGGYRATAAPVPNLSGVVAIADGGGQCVVLRTDGTVWTWGRNNAGQLGQGTFTPDPGTNVPGPVVNADGTVFDGVVAIGPGEAIRSDGSVWAWGGNTSGQLGNGTVTPSPPDGIPNPVQVLGSGGIGVLVGPVALGGHGERFAVDIATPYAWSGVLQPVNADGTSVFKRNSTVQLKFKLANQSAGITDAQARFGYAQINSNNPGPVNETTSNAAGTSGILFQYDAASGEYHYNWNTKGLGTGRYLVRIDLGDGVMRTVVVGLN